MPSSGDDEVATAVVEHHSSGRLAQFRRSRQGWGYLSGEAAPLGSVNSDDGHQFQRPRSNAMDGTRSVRTKNVSKRMANAIVNPSCRDWSELPAMARTVKVQPRMRPAALIVPPRCPPACHGAVRQGRA